MPRDTYVRIGQAARIAGVSVDTLRRWEADGKLVAVRSLGGQRTYRVADIERLRDGDEDVDPNGEAPRAISGSTRPGPPPLPPWKAREANAAADLSVTKFRIHHREEVRRYREAQQQRLEAQRAEQGNRAAAARLHAEQKAEWQRQQQALDSCLQSIRSSLWLESSAVCAEVERFLADHATPDASIPWIQAEATAIIDRRRAEREATADRERQEAADQIRRNALVRHGESFVRELTADREEWDADDAREVVEEVEEHLAEVVQPTWSEKRVEREVAEVLGEWD